MGGDLERGMDGAGLQELKGLMQWGGLLTGHLTSAGSSTLDSEVPPNSNGSMNL